MKTSRWYPLAVSAAALVAGILLSGCSAFQSSRKMDMSPFADNTRTLFVEAAKVGTPFHWDYLKPYFARADWGDIRTRMTPLMGGFQAVIMYSNQVVALNNAKLKDKEKNAQLVKYLDQAIRRTSNPALLDSIEVDAALMKEVFEDIRNGETFLDGIAAASPLVNAVVASMEDNLNAIQAQIPVTIASIDRMIEADYADRRANYANLTRLQVVAMRGMTQLYNARRGGQSSLDTLLAEDPSLREMIPSPEKATSKGMAAAEALLTDRLSKLDTFIHQMDTEVAIYRAKLRELEEWRINVDARVKIAHDGIIIWAQSHRNLGAGIPVPPLIDVGGMATGLAKKVSPVPIP